VEVLEKVKSNSSIKHDHYNMNRIETRERTREEKRHGTNSIRCQLYIHNLHV